MEINAAAMWIMTTFMQLDMNIASFVHRLYDLAAWLFTPLAEAFAFIGDPVPVVVVAVALILFRKTRRYGVAMFISFCIGALLTNCCLKLLVARPRPFADQTASLLSSLLGPEKADFYKNMWLSVGQSMESDNSFPSGHTCAAMASGIAVFIAGNKKISWLALLYPIFMGISRIYLVVHYATDVFAGAIVGFIAALIGMLLVYPRIPEVFFDFNIFHHSGKKAGRSSSGKHLAK